MYVHTYYIYTYVIFSFCFQFNLKRTTQLSGDLVSTLCKSICKVKWIHSLKNVQSNSEWL